MFLGERGYRPVLKDMLRDLKVVQTGDFTLASGRKNIGSTS